MTRRSNLDDPDIAAIAWSRYRRLMRWMALLAVVCVLIALGLLYIQLGMLTLAMILATAGGVGLSVLLMAALMGLVFLSSGTGHDEAIDNAMEDDSPDASDR